MTLLESLNWRYATKRMNGEKVPQEKIDAILEAARLAPTSSGLQPFKIIVITDRELLGKIQQIAHNQPQITEASHLLVFAANDNITDEQIDEVYGLISKERGMSEESLKNYTSRLKGMIAARTKEERFESAARQAYIAFGIAIAAAATEKVDATPMEGFNSEALDRLLGLPEKGLKSITLLPLGYRDEEKDWLVRMKKVRKPREQMIIEYH